MGIPSFAPPPTCYTRNLPAVIPKLPAVLPQQQQDRRSFASPPFVGQPLFSHPAPSPAVSKQQQRNPGKITSNTGQFSYTNNPKAARARARENATVRYDGPSRFELPYLLEGCRERWYAAMRNAKKARGSVLHAGFLRNAAHERNRMAEYRMCERALDTIWKDQNWMKWDDYKRLPDPDSAGPAVLVGGR